MGRESEECSGSGSSQYSEALASTHGEPSSAYVSGRIGPPEPSPNPRAVFSPYA
jgi:hypothetical protein